MVDSGLFVAKERQLESTFNRYCLKLSGVGVCASFQERGELPSWEALLGLHPQVSLLL